MAVGGFRCRIKSQEQCEEFRRVAIKVVDDRIRPGIERVGSPNLPVESVVGVDNADDRPYQAAVDTQQRFRRTGRVIES